MPRQRIIRSVKTRWLSCDQAIEAAKSEIMAVWDALQFFADERNDAKVVGLLSMSRQFQFICNIYVLNATLPYLNALSRLFQTGDLNIAL